jgi:hypothetical protein
MLENPERCPDYPACWPGWQLLIAGMGLCLRCCRARDGSALVQPGDYAQVLGAVCQEVSVTLGQPCPPSVHVLPGWSGALGVPLPNCYLVGCRTGTFFCEEKSVTAVVIKVGVATALGVKDRGASRGLVVDCLYLRGGGWVLSG